ncbi:MAG: hypothetical protein U0271_22050 [Polyangiaceae bacterium]
MRSVIGVLTVALVVGCGGGGGGGNKAEHPSNNTKKQTTEAKAAPPLPPEKKKNPIPEDWEPFENKPKQFGFWLPTGSTTNDSTENGIEMFHADLPDPYPIEVWVVTYRDKTLSKEDLWVDVDAVISNNLKGTKLDLGPVVDLNNVFAVRDATWTEVSPIKGTVLVGTDINDNYIMIVSCREGDYESNHDTVDALWESFYLF